MFCGQSDFCLLPRAVRTNAPAEKTPVLREHLSRDHLSTIIGITLEGKHNMAEQERAFKEEDMLRFLTHLIGQIPGKLLVIWTAL